ETSTTLSPTSESLATAAKAYLMEMELRQRAGQISASHVRSQGERLTYALKGMSDKPMSELIEHDVASMILRLAALPTKTKGHKHKKCKPQRISVTTAKNCLNTLRWFLIWADETERWIAPKRLNKLFKQVRFKQH